MKYKFLGSQGQKVFKLRLVYMFSSIYSIIYQVGTNIDGLSSLIALCTLQSLYKTPGLLPTPLIFLHWA